MRLTSEILLSTIIPNSTANLEHFKGKMHFSLQHSEVRVLNAHLWWLLYAKFYLIALGLTFLEVFCFHISCNNVFHFSRECSVTYKLTYKNKEDC